MKYSKILLSALAIAAFTFSGCGGDGDSTPSEDNQSNQSDQSDQPGSQDDKYVTLSGIISSDKVLDATKTYLLDGKVKVAKGAKLTVPAGTTIAGKTPSSFLLISAGAELIAKGTKDKPIVFTSKTDVDGQSSNNSTGEWGGLIILGNASTHYGVAKYEADETESFGCDNANVPCVDDQSSGDLEYVLIKHSGFEVEKDKELNGLSLGGVGSGTVLKNIAIVGGSDDGIEIWGGRANIDGLYVYNAKDDSVDTDLGYRGTIKNVLVKQVRVAKTNNHDSAAMEFGNDNNTITTDDSNATQPTIENFTAYVKGGGFYNKYDAGFKWNNVKFISDKTEDFELVHFRGTDSYDSDGKHIDGDVCFQDSAVTLTAENTYSKENSKDPKDQKTAYQYFVTDQKQQGSGVIHYDTSCTGANEANIWKGKAGSNEPLEQ